LDLQQHPADDPDKPIQLPFSAKKQDAVLGHFLINPRFYQQARHRIKAGWFIDPSAGKVVVAKNKFYEMHKRIPTVEELTEWGDFVTEESSVREKMRRKVQIAVVETANYGLDGLSQELQGWFQAIQFRESATQATRLFNAGRFDECYTFFDRKLDEIRQSRFVDDGEHEFDNVSGDIEQERLDRENACTLGMGLLDRALLPDAPGGSLLPGDQTVILGSTNAGKTRVMATIIGHNVRRRKSVLWFGHEGRPNDLAMLLRCSLIGCTRAELFELMRTEDGRRRIENITKWIKKYVTFVPYMKAGMNVEDVEPIIRTKCEERMAKNNGKTYDLFVSDYPAKLGTMLARGGHMSPRHIYDYVYNYHVNLAGEYGFHSLVGFQTNREGAKVQNGLRGGVDTERLLTPEDAGEAYGPMQTATNVITLNRPPIFKAKGLLTFYFGKSRSSETGWAVCCKSDYSRVLTHSDGLGGVSYRGTSSMIEQMDNYMEQYFNGAVPEALSLG